MAWITDSLPPITNIDQSDIVWVKTNDSVVLANWNSCFKRWYLSKDYYHSRFDKQLTKGSGYLGWQPLMPPI